MLNLKIIDFMTKTADQGRHRSKRGADMQTIGGGGHGPVLLGNLEQTI